MKSSSVLCVKAHANLLMPLTFHSLNSNLSLPTFYPQEHILLLSQNSLHSYPPRSIPVHSGSELNQAHCQLPCMCHGILPTTQLGGWGGVSVPTLQGRMLGLSEVMGPAQRHTAGKSQRHDLNP